jgi:hypothetical protein
VETPITTPTGHKETNSKKVFQKSARGILFGNGSTRTGKNVAAVVFQTHPLFLDGKMPKWRSGELYPLWLHWWTTFMDFTCLLLMPSLR